ncbi:hypothetical protein MGYG_02506 [Nannizzia gypsea CBS 118893]|uniref:Uncharacterized protein n=1 Tax=Arthroderma gypseum (strain ATCC MYA-4604 / CBS 118893) TaxID=535722 RepID=E4UMX9_ARTGP|nr:hypothetical protein MGYG_02506 [Nannizzia gypsea CBS 118893]EFQ99493.1 hypothetical protein MGYG_02506 [Nannizzia gypsea CBS 118893]
MAALLSVASVDAADLEHLVPVATPAGLVALNGMSPIPTPPPGLPAGIPPELMKRQSGNSTSLLIPFPPPAYYCGLVDGDPENPLTCVNARATCIYTGNAAGCCLSKNINDCTTIPTTCYPSSVSCDSACSRDSLALKCSISTLPYCGTYVFNQNTKLYGCYSYASVSDNISPLSQYFSSVLGPDYASKYSATHIPSTTTDTSDQPSGTTSGDFPDTTTSGHTTPYPPPPPPPQPKGLGGGAIAGIVVGCVAGVSAILIAIWWFILRKKPDNTPAPAPATAYTQNNNMPPTGMNPQGYNQNPAVGGGYYAPVEQKPPVEEQPPTYPNEQKISPFNQPPQQPPQHAEMPGSTVSSPQQMSPIPSELASTPMTATHNGPVPEQIYEMGPGR